MLKPPDPLTTARLRIEEQAQTFEIHLGHLARRRRRHAHRIAAPTMAWSVAQPPDEAFQRGVRDVQAMVTQQLLHTRQLQMLIPQPRRDLLAIRVQPICLR
jgi:hypothetical protein